MNKMVNECRAWLKAGYQPSMNTSDHACASVLMIVSTHVPGTNMTQSAGNGMHSSKFKKKNATVHMMVRFSRIQVIQENMRPRNILPFRLTLCSVLEKMKYLPFVK